VIGTIQPALSAVRAQKASSGMTIDTTTNDTPLSHPGPYLDVVRLGDGRYCVQFVKHGVVPRTSYTGQASAVVKQAQRAGNIPIHTSDTDLRRLCRDQLVELI
jgi:hypothetical protein